MLYVNGTLSTYALFSCAAEVRRTKGTSGRTTAAGEPWTSPCTCGIGSHAIFSYKHACYGFQKFSHAYALFCAETKWKKQLTCFFNSGQQPICFLRRSTRRGDEAGSGSWDVPSFCSSFHKLIKLSLSTVSSSLSSVYALIHKSNMMLSSFFASVHN